MPEHDRLSSLLWGGRDGERFSKRCTHVYFSCIIARLVILRINIYFPIHFLSFANWPDIIIEQRILTFRDHYCFMSFRLFGELFHLSSNDIAAQLIQNPSNFRHDFVVNILPGLTYLDIEL